MTPIMGRPPLESTILAELRQGGLWTTSVVRLAVSRPRVEVVAALQALHADGLVGYAEGRWFAVRREA